MKQTFLDLYKKLHEYYRAGLITVDELVEQLDDFLKTYKEVI